MHDWAFLSDHMSWLGSGHGVIALGFWLLVIAAIAAMAVYIIRSGRRPPPKDR